MVQVPDSHRPARRLHELLQHEGWGVPQVDVGEWDLNMCICLAVNDAAVFTFLLTFPVVFHMMQVTLTPPMQE
jgi:hypothetical protein